MNFERSEVAAYGGTRKKSGLEAIVVAVALVAVISAALATPLSQATGSAASATSATAAPSSFSVPVARPIGSSQPIGGPLPSGSTACTDAAAIPFAAQITILPNGTAYPYDAPVAYSPGLVTLTSPVNGSILDLASNVTIDGSGCPLVYTTTASTHDGNLTAIEVRYASNVTIENFPVTTNDSQVGVYVNHSASVTVYNVLAPSEGTGFGSNASVAVNFTRDSANDASVGFDFTTTVVGIAEDDQANGSGVGFEATSTDGITIQDSAATGTTTGADLTYDEWTTIATTDLSGASDAAVNAPDASANDLLTDDNLSGSGSAGVNIDYALTTFTVNDSQITGGWIEGIDASNAYGALVFSGNDLANATTDAISVIGSAGPLTIAANNLSVATLEPDAIGIYVEELGGALNITGNALNGGLGSAIWLETAVVGTVDIDGNQITDSGEYAIYADAQLYGSLFLLNNVLRAGPLTIDLGGHAVDIPGGVDGSIYADNNTITGGFANAVYVDADVYGSIALVDNDLTNATEDSIAIYGVGGNLYVIGNDLSANASTVTDNPTGVDVYGLGVGGTTTISYNNLSGGLYYAVDIDPFLGFEAYSSPPPSGTITLTGNDLSNVTDIGVYIGYDGGDLDLYQNNFAANSSTAGSAVGLYVDDWTDFDFDWWALQGSLNVVDNNFSGGLNYGLWVTSSVAGSVTIVGNDFANQSNGGYAIYLYYVDGSLTVDRNDLTANASTAGDAWAIEVDTGVGGAVSIVDNNMSGGEFGGIGLEAPYAPVFIAGNDISNVTAIAITLQDSDGITIVDNDLSENATLAGFATGIDIEVYATTALIAGNNLSGGLAYGIYDEHTTALIVTNNTITGTTRFGVMTYADSNITIAGNNLAGNGAANQTGISVDGGYNISITNNDLLTSGTGINVTGVDGPVLISGNDAAGAVWALNSTDSYPGYFETVQDNDFSGSGSLTINTSTLDFVGNDLLGTPSVTLGNDSIYRFYHNDIDTGIGTTFVTNGTVLTIGSYNAPLPVGGNYWSGYTPVSVTDGIGFPAYAIGGAADNYPLAQPWYPYTITFTETGLANGTVWGVSISGLGNFTATAPSSIVLSPTNGQYLTYTYTVLAMPGPSPVPPGGTFTANGTTLAFAISFEYGYPVTFTESGLPSATNWSVTLAGQTGSASSPGSILFPTITNGTHSFTVAAVAGYNALPPSGAITMNGTAISVAILFVPLVPGEYAVTFTESGLPSGTSWNVTFNGAGESALAPSANVFTPVLNGTYAYSVASVTGYRALPSSGSVIVNGSSPTVQITFAPIVANEYAITFVVSGLPSGATYSVTLGGSTQSSVAPSPVVFTPLTNGTYAYVAGGVPGYRALPANGSVTIQGASPTVTITYAANGTNEYAVTFTESGLPVARDWNATLAGVTESASAPNPIVFAGLVNATYLYSILPSAPWYVLSGANGSVTVQGGDATVSAAYSYTSGVTFHQSGIPGNVRWNVTATLVTPAVGPASPADAQDSWSTSALGPTATLPLANGTYSYTVTAPGYTSAQGTFDVSGSAVSIGVAVAATYSVTFTEHGLPTGTNWTVTFNGTIESSTTATIVFTSLNASSLAFRAGSVSGYSVSPSSGTVSVDGGPVARSIAYSSSSSSPSLPLWLWAVIGAVIVVIVVVLVLLLLARRRSGPPHAGPSTSSGAPAAPGAASPPPPSAGGSSGSPTPPAAPPSSPPPSPSPPASGGPEGGAP